MSITRLAAVGAALLMLTVLTISRSQAAFTATTDNTSNSFSTGTVSITDDDSGSTMFTVTNMQPNTAVVECIEVDYTGSVFPTTVKLHGVTTGTLDTYLNTQIELGTGGGYGDCASFVTGSTLFTNTLENFGATHTNYANGLTVYTPTIGSTNRTLRFTVTLQDNNSAQGLSSTAAFTFEVQN